MTGQNGSVVLLDQFGRPIQPSRERRFDDFALPTVLTKTSIFRGAYDTYLHQKWDEARRHSDEDALAMKRDCWIHSMLRERTDGTVGKKWHLEVEDEKDPEQVKVRDLVEKALRRTPRIRRFMRILLKWGLWYGRYAQQIIPQWMDIDGQKMLTIKKWAPIDGDNLNYQFDGTPCILVNSAYADQLGKAEIATTSLGRAVLLKGSWRDRFIIHSHDPEPGDFFDGEAAGGIHGVGIRSWIFWNDWLKQEFQSWIIDFFDRIGLGVVVVYFEQGNQDSETAADTFISTLSRRTVVKLPRPPGTLQSRQANGAPGIEIVDAPSAGVEAVKALIEDQEKKIERFIIGQSASSKSDTSGMGTHDTDSQDETKNELMASDAEDFAETMTGSLEEPGLVSIIFKYSFPRLFNKFPLYFRYAIDEEDPSEKLEAVSKAVSFGVSFREDEVRELTGLSKPAPGDKVIGGQQQQPGGMPGMGGMPNGQQPGIGGTGSAGQGDVNAGGMGVEGQGQEGMEGEMGQAGDEADGSQESASFLDYLDSLTGGSGAVGYFRDDEVVLYNPANWTQTRGPRGGSVWTNTVTQKKVYGKENPGGKEVAAQQRTEARQVKGLQANAAKVEKTAKTEADVTQADKLLGEMMEASKGGETPDPVHMHRLGEMLGSLKRPALNALKKKYGLKASGTNPEVAAKIAEKALGGKVKASLKPTLASVAEGLGIDPAEAQKRLGADAQQFEAMLKKLGGGSDVGTVAGNVAGVSQPSQAAAPAQNANGPGNPPSVPASNGTDQGGNGAGPATGGQPAPAVKPSKIADGIEFTDPSRAADAAKVLGSKMSGADLAAAAGIPPGLPAKVTSVYNGVVTVTAGAEDYEPGSGATNFTREFFRDPQGNLVVRNAQIALGDDMKGKGTEIFARQVAEAKKHGVAYMVSDGSRVDGENGYYTLPRWGYDGPVPQESLAKMPTNLRSQAGEPPTLLRLMSSPEGREWWKANGGTAKGLKFDLRDGSPSMKALKAYQQERQGDANRSQPAGAAQQPSDAGAAKPAGSGGQQPADTGASGGGSQPAPAAGTGREAVQPVPGGAGSQPAVKTQQATPAHLQQSIEQDVHQAIADELQSGKRDKHNRMVPIHEIRDRMKAKHPGLSDADFDEAARELWRQGKLGMEELSDLGEFTPEQFKKSIETKGGGGHYFGYLEAKRQATPDPQSQASEPPTPAEKPQAPAQPAPKPAANPKEPATQPEAKPAATGKAVEQAKAMAQSMRHGATPYGGAAGLNAHLDQYIGELSKLPVSEIAKVWHEGLGKAVRHGNKGDYLKAIRTHMMGQAGAYDRAQIPDADVRRRGEGPSQHTTEKRARDKANLEQRLQSGEHVAPEVLEAFGLAKKPEAKAAPPAHEQHPQAVAAAMKKLDTQGNNLVSIADVRDELARQGIDSREAQDSAINHLRRSDHIEATGYEGRHATSDPARHKRELAGSIKEGDRTLGYLSFRPGKQQAEVQPEAQGSNPPHIQKALDLMKQDQGKENTATDAQQYAAELAGMTPQDVQRVANALGITKRYPGKKQVLEAIRNKLTETGRADESIQV